MRNGCWLAAILCSGLCGAAARHPGASSLNLRLATQLTSYDSVTGSAFRAAVIAPYELDGVIVIPLGSVVHGTVRRTRDVGYGVVRERATMDLSFEAYELPDGRRFPFRGTLRSVHNARESVNEEGQIRGILAASGPQNLVGGIWHRPSFDLIGRSFVGLTGTGGRIFSEYSMGPIGGAVLFAIRCTIFRLPEPEIRLPAGTELKVTVTSLPLDVPTFVAPEPSSVPEELSAWLASRPLSINRPGRPAADDIINVAFAGSRQDLVQAFEAAGWREAERFTMGAVSRGYTAYTTQTGYAAAPMSKLLYESEEADLVFQKSFNTLSKRDHIRIWRADDGVRELWLGAATHDIGVKFNSAVTMTHRIHRRVDSERSKVVNDLDFAGCVNPVAYIDRPKAVKTEDDGSGVVTDGRLAVLYLRERCTGVSRSVSPEMPSPPNSRAGRMIRRMMLEGRQYALRGNAYYWLYRAMAFNRDRREAQAIEE